MISRCSSPIPEMSVCPVSSSVRTRKVGSSSERRCSALPSLSWSPFVFGSIATEITGSGKVIDSSLIGAVSIARVSPVVVCFRPTTAAISPAPISSRSSRWFACICRMRPIRSALPVVVFRTRSPCFICPEYTRMYVSFPTYGSDMTLNASAENGSSRSARRDTSWSVRGSLPCTGGTSSGDGR